MQNLENFDVAHLSYDELDALQVPDESVSDKYVLLKSTDIIDALSPEFEVQDIQQWNVTNSLHTVTLYNKENDLTIAFENAFSGKNAFYMRLSEDLHIPLNFGRQVHSGSPASTMVEHFQDAKLDIIQAAVDAKDVYQKLKTTNIPQFIKDDIEKLVFGHILPRKNFIAMIYDDQREHNTFAEYINFIINAQANSAFVVEMSGKNGTTLKSVKVPLNKFDGVYLQQKIYKYIKKELPMTFI